jgi:hypothetical protein
MSVLFQKKERERTPMKQYLLTQEEFDLLFSSIEQAHAKQDDMTKEPGDDADQEAQLLARLENELLWQHQYGQRRPVQQ